MSTNTLRTTPACLPAEMLHKMMPPQAVIHVGIGKGVGDMNCWQQWDVPRALLIDADPARLAWAEKLTANNAGWQVRESVLAAQEGEVEFYQASNPDEDGLLAPEALQNIWPNLKNKTQTTKQSSSLQQVSEQSGWLPADSNDLLWLLVDCLPALPVLEGAGSLLSRCGVIWVRVLLDPLVNDNRASLQEVDAWLTPKGYCCVHVAEGNHPAIGHAMFARDWRLECDAQYKRAQEQQVQLNQLTKERDNQTKVTQDHEAQLAQMSKERENQTKVIQEYQTRIEQLSKERDNHASAAQQSQAQLEQLAKERETQTQVIQEHQAHIEQLGIDRDSHAKVAQERQAQIEQLQAERDAHAKTIQEQQARIEQLSKEREDQIKLTSDQQTQIEQLTKDCDAQVKLAQERQAKVEQLGKECDTQAKLSQDRQVQIEKLGNECDTQTKLAQDLQAQIDRLSKERESLNELAAERQTRIEQLTIERDTQAKLAQENQVQKDKALKQLEQIKWESEEVTGRQQLINEEMTKAEAQIDLIKDLLLRESGL